MPSIQDERVAPNPNPNPNPHPIDVQDERVAIATWISSGLDAWFGQPVVRAQTLMAGASELGFEKYSYTGAT